MFRFKAPSHRVVSACTCVRDSEPEGSHSGSVETFDERADCGTLNGVRCTSGDYFGRLKDCEKRSVVAETSVGFAQVFPVVRK